MAIAADISPLEERALINGGLSVLEAIAHLERILIEPTQTSIRKRCGDHIDAHTVVVRLENAGLVTVRHGGPSIGYLRVYTTEKGRSLLTRTREGQKMTA